MNNERHYLGDYVPPDKALRGGRLVSKSSVTDPEDPYVLIERLKLQVADLERRIDMQELADLQEGLAQARARIGDLERDNASLGLRLKAAEEHAAAVADENGKLKEDVKIAKGVERVRRGKELPPVTPAIEELARVTKERDEALKRLADLEAQKGDDGPTKKRRAEKPPEPKEG